MRAIRVFNWRTRSGSQIASEVLATDAGVSDGRERARVAPRIAAGVIAGGAVAVACFLPLFGASPYILDVGTIVLLYIPLAIGQNLVSGNTGLVTMGQAALYGVGAYVAAIASVRFGFDAPLAMLLAVVGTGIVACGIALTTVTVQGDYLMIVSLGINLIFLDVVIGGVSWSGGYVGMPGIAIPSFGPIHIDSGIGFYYLALFGTAVAIVVAEAVLHSHLGRAMEALRDDSVAATLVGIRTMPIKIGIFALAGAMSGLSGAILAYYLSYVGPSDFTTQGSLVIFEMVIIGGLGSVPGSILGAVLLIGIPELLRSVEAYSVGIGGVLIVIMMIVRPQGILGKPPA